MIVYHGAIEEIKSPDVSHSLRNLDFGNGFYVTSVKEQAERWAKRKHILHPGSLCIVNVYEYSELTEQLSVLKFEDALDQWIDFVCACRDGKDDYKGYDIISGKVANDKVYRVLDMYRRGIWDKVRAISEMKIYETYDQIAFTSQEAIQKCLKFISSYEVEL